jgi:hypothetical protein
MAALWKYTMIEVFQALVTEDRVEYNRRLKNWHSFWVWVMDRMQEKRWVSEEIFKEVRLSKITHPWLPPMPDTPTNAAQSVTDPIQRT